METTHQAMDLRNDSLDELPAELESATLDFRRARKDNLASSPNP